MDSPFNYFNLIPVAGIKAAFRSSVCALVCVSVRVTVGCRSRTPRGCLMRAACRLPCGGPRTPTTQKQQKKKQEPATERKVELNSDNGSVSWKCNTSVFQSVYELVH